MEEKEVQFFVILCHDVFLEILRWGNRRQHVKLERVGQRFHWNIERWFWNTPFLRLSLLLAPRFLFFIVFFCYFYYCYLIKLKSIWRGLEAKIAGNPVGNKKSSDFSDISLNAVFPPFLRFYLIKLVMSWSDYDTENAWDKQSIVEKCQFFEDQMKLIKPEILGRSILVFSGAVDANYASRFSDHSELLKYLSNRILPFCDIKPRGYHFFIDLYSEVGIWSNAGRDIISSLLQMPQITCCSNARIRIFNNDQMKLPIKEISNWLHRKWDGQRKKLLLLRIYLSIYPIQRPLKIRDFFDSRHETEGISHITYSSRPTKNII